MVPTDQTRIRLEAGVPVFATWKSHPTKDSEFLDWYKRIEAARTIYEGQAGMAQDALKALLESHAVTHVIWPQSKGAFPFSQMGRQVFGDNNFSLWDLRIRQEPFYEFINAHLLTLAKAVIMVPTAAYKKLHHIA